MLSKATMKEEGGDQEPLSLNLAIPTKQEWMKGLDIFFFVFWILLQNLSILAATYIIIKTLVGSLGQTNSVFFKTSSGVWKS